MVAELGPGLTALTLSSPLGIPLSTALPMMAVAILRIWAAHCAPEASPVHVSTPEASPAHESALEACPVHKSFLEASPVHESTPEVAASTAEPPEVAPSAAETPEVAASAAEPPKVAASASELFACPITAMEAVHELSLPCHSQGGRS